MAKVLLIDKGFCYTGTNLVQIKMDQVRQEYQLLLILSEQLKEKQKELQAKEQKKNKSEWWLEDEASLEIVKKMHDIVANFKYKPPVAQNDSSMPKKKKINFQVR